MPRTPADVLTRARVLFEDTDLSSEIIAKRLGVSAKSVYRWRVAHKKTGGELYLPPSAKRGRPQTLTPEQEDWMLAFLEDQPAAHRDEIALALSDEFDGLVVSTTLVSRTLARREWSRDKAKRKVIDSAGQLRASWAAKKHEWQLDQLVFIDENAANERTGWRKRGWSPKGVSLAALQGTKRSEKWSILPAMTVHGYLQDSTLVYQGTITKEQFVGWLEEGVLPKLRPGYHILMMDDCSVYHKEVEDLCKSHGLEIQYFPPYSPRVNPIEFAMDTLKVWIPRHLDEQINFETFGHFLQHALEAALTSEGNSAVNYIRNCGYERVDNK